MAIDIMVISITYFKKTRISGAPVETGSLIKRKGRGRIWEVGRGTESIKKCNSNTCYLRDFYDSCFSVYKYKYINDKEKINISM